jgi:ribosomal protein S18 acetylase RimI-like enzyme
VKPGRDWTAVAADRGSLGELQAFYESNPDYWLLVYGHAPAADEAQRDFEGKPPPEMSYSTLNAWLIRDRESQRIIGEVSAIVDLLAAGVTHLGFFIIDAAKRGSGLAHEVYANYEAWAVAQGARWLRLGVVEANARGRSFWRRLGYAEVRRRENYVLGDRSHNLVVMIKPVVPNTLDDYLARVARDRPDSE